jgi:hypothetical protein
VERLALARWDGVASDESYLGDDAASCAHPRGQRSRVGQLVDAGRIPYETTPHGRRLFRREQLEVIGNARLSRRLAAS